MLILNLIIQKNGTVQYLKMLDLERINPFIIFWLKIREKLKNLSTQHNFEPIFPPKNLCSDNAAMIAWAGIERFKLGFLNKLDFPAKARWPLDEKAPFLKGTGIKF